MLTANDVADQEREFWCWAAVVQMLRRHFELAERRQCEIVGTRLRRECCSSTPAACNVPHRMDSFGDLLRTEGIASTGGVPPRPLDENELESELYSDRPVVVGWIWDRGAGHFVLAFQRPKTGTRKPNKRFYWWPTQERGFAASPMTGC